MVARGRGLPGEEGQMVVELAVTLPAVLVVFVIAVDCLMFAGACAAFDHLVPQAVLANCTSPGVAEAAEQSRESAVHATLVEEFPPARMQVEVASTGGSGGTTVYTCTLRAVPWPLASPGATVLGVRVPTVLEHRCSFAVRPVAVVS